MIKVQKGLEKNESVKSPFLTKNKDLKGPADVVTSSTFNTFKSALDKYYKEFFWYFPWWTGFLIWEPQQHY